MIFLPSFHSASVECLNSPLLSCGGMWNYTLPNIRLNYSPPLNLVLCLWTQKSKVIYLSQMYFFF